MPKGLWVTCAERKEMQSMRDAGHSVPSIALAFDCCRQTIAKHTTAKPFGSRNDDRNAYLIRITKGRPLHERDMIARRFGLANAKSLEVTLSLHRRKMRLQAASAQVSA